MIRTATIAAVVGYASAALAAPQAGDTLACESKDPNKQLVAVVGIVEPFRADTMVAHVTLFNDQPGAPLPQVAHLPIDLKTLAASCPQPASKGHALSPHFQEGLQQWRDAVATGRAGIFTVSADQIDDMLRGQVQRMTDNPKP